MSGSYFSDGQPQYHYNVAYDEFPLDFPVLFDNLLNWRWPTSESQTSFIFKAPAMVAPNERQETALLHDDVPDSLPVETANLATKKFTPATPVLDHHLSEEPIVANEDPQPPLSTSTVTNVAALPVVAHASASAPPTKQTKDLDVGKENGAQVSDHQVVSGSLKATKTSTLSKKRKLVLILPKVVDAGVAPGAGDILPPKKRKRGSAAEGKRKIVRRKYTNHQDDNGLKYKQCNLCEEAIYGDHRNHAKRCGMGPKMAPSHTHSTVL